MGSRLVTRIVRAESGCISYINTKRAHSDENRSVQIDEQTAPFLRPYRREINVQPPLVSYGHRPTSANRIFLAGTMAVRLKHDELAMSALPGSLLGLPTSTLQSVLHSASGGRDANQEDDEDEEEEEWVAESPLADLDYSLKVSQDLRRY